MVTRDNSYLSSGMLTSFLDHTLLLSYTNFWLIAVLFYILSWNINFFKGYGLAYVSDKVFGLLLITFNHSCIVFECILRFELSPTLRQIKSSSGRASVLCSIAHFSSWAKSLNYTGRGDSGKFSF